MTALPTEPPPAPAEGPAPADQLALDLPGVTVTDVGLSFVGGLEGDTAIAAAVRALGRLARSEAWTRWAVGDLFLALRAAHDGDDAPVYVALAGAGSWSPAWLNQAIEVSDRIPLEDRRPGLSWGHHHVVAIDALDGEQRSSWLGLAIANRWSVATLGQAVATALSQQEQLEGMGDPDGAGGSPRPKLGAAVVARIFEAAQHSPDGWVRLHPQSGQVRAEAGAG